MQGLLFIVDLFVHLSDRGQGLANTLVASVVDAYQDRRIGLRVDSDNGAAIRLYERHGFVPR